MCSRSPNPSSRSSTSSAATPPISRIKLDEQLAVDFIPTRTLLLPVNKENAVKSGIVKPEDAHLMVDTITINLQASSLRKSEMMLLDLLANFDWERPLYVTSPSLVANFGLQDYLQFDGYAYRLVPIKTTYTDLWNAGRIDTDLLYHNLMEVYRYGNVADPRVYVDTFVNYNFNATNIRIAFARLGAELARRGEKEKAVEVLDYGLEQMPVSQFQYTYQYLPHPGLLRSKSHREGRRPLRQLCEESRRVRRLLPLLPGQPAVSHRKPVRRQRRPHSPNCTASPKITDAPTVRHGY